MSDEMQTQTSQQNDSAESVERKNAPYSMEEAMKVTDDILKLAEENKYNVGAFIHGLIMSSEYAQYAYGIPQQQIAAIRRDSRKYIRDLADLQQKIQTSPVESENPAELDNEENSPPEKTSEK